MFNHKQDWSVQRIHMRINEIIVETISDGQVYGWIDPHGQEYQTDTYDARHHNDILKYLVSTNTPGTEHWKHDAPPEYIFRGGPEYDYISQALSDGWIRIGAVDHEYVFAQLIPGVKRRPLNYLLRIILKFKPPITTIDIMTKDGRAQGRAMSKEFDNPRQAIAWIRNETGL